MSEFMDAAIGEAKAAALRNEVPVGAVLVKDRVIIAQNGNRIQELKDPTAHAEVLVIRDGAITLGNERLYGCELYVTLEPCTMCAAAISFSRISRLYFGAEDIKGGGVENGVRYFDSPTCHHIPEYYGGLQAESCGELLKEFFANKR
ncbi:MAG: nucleoside deaminase [Hyphomicrobiales bacterium]|nr:nucleoside deaminase [Hyphomicrobiales bacterium]